MRSTISALAFIALAASSPARAEGDRAPIRLVIGVPAGGSIDLIARLLADKMKDTLNEQVVVESHAGAGGRIAVMETRKSAPDGHTIYIGTSGPFSVLPNIYGSKLEYD